MKMPVVQSESHCKFEPFRRRHWINPPTEMERRGRLDDARRRWEPAETSNTTNEAGFIIPLAGGRGLRAGAFTGLTEERAWCAHTEPDPSLSNQSSSVAAPQPQPAQSVHNRILIADDDASVRGSLAAVLESEGFVVDEARNGIEAVTRAIEHEPDLVLLDLNMPHWDGWTAFSQLDRVTPLLPVIVITARPNQYQKAVQLGVDAFMEKPLNIPVLMRAINQLTSEGDQRQVRRFARKGFVTQLLVSPTP